MDLMARFDLESTYLALDGAGRVAQLAGGPAFWASVDEQPAAGGTLVIVSTGEGDWAHWEMHPKGDEVLVLLEGRARMLFEADGGEQVHDMAPGATLVVPAGTWHRAVEQRDMRMLFITHGEGTQHRPVQA
jgi:mannose-6-phosphate isomerase-like protein (cupin superfamily)